MKNIRIIPRLDIKGPNVVKGIHLEGLRVMGSPSDFAKFYYEAGADELMFMDVVASLYERNSLHHIISETAKHMFIPLTVGGGVRTIEDIRNVLRAGADKICLNTAAIKDPSIIKEASRKFGSSTIVVAIEIIREKDGRFLAYTDNGREFTGVNAIDWAQKAAELGAGELVITSVDKEGTGEGYDIDLIKQIATSVSIPVIAHGGGGKMEDVIEVIQHGKADAVAIASMLHYDLIKKNHLDNSSDMKEGNREFLNQKRAFHTFQTTTINELKQYLKAKAIPCRLEV